MYKLVILDDEGHTTVVPLLRDEITIGRQEGNSIRLTERNVSRSHARLLKRNQAYIVEDLGSYNGVSLNGERIDEKAELAAGDQLAIGDYDLAYQSDVAPKVRTTPSPKSKSEPPPRLVVLSDPAAGAEFSLSKPALRIGRDERLDIWINHRSISHEHAEVQLKDGLVTVFDLDSANGMRINGIRASRAVLEAGDVLELGEVRFRFLSPQGAHSLEPLPVGAPATGSPEPSQKPLVAVSVIGLLLAATAGAVFVTVRNVPPQSVATDIPVGAVASAPEGSPTAIRSTGIPIEGPSPAERQEVEAVVEDEISDGGDSDSHAVDEPQEWEERLSRARQALAKGQIDRAYAIANDLPTDSVLRETLEFGEIRYRYAQAHITEGELAVEERDLERARREAKLVLQLDGITSKQRLDAKRLMKSAREPKPNPNLALEEAYGCVARGDNACVVRALERGKARSPAALALLIETYRAMDDFSAARRHMQTFVKRHPDNPRTPKYRQLLAAD